MLKNYLKITWAVMKRRKFYTFISLFGISVTLTILIIITSFVDQMLAPTYPEVHRNRSLYVNSVEIWDKKTQTNSKNPLSEYAIKTYIKPLPFVEKVAIASMPMSQNVYLNKQKCNPFIKYTDANFWKITEFEFLEGKGYTDESIESNDKVVVINDIIRDDYFGKGVPVVGKTLELNDNAFRIVGVVKNCPFTQIFVGSDIYLPTSADASPKNNTDLGGRYNAIILAKTVADMPKIQDELKSIAGRISLKGDKDIASKKIGSFDGSSDSFDPDSIVMKANYYAECFTENLTGNRKGDTGYYNFFIILGIFAFLFMLLPALNLININISRIMERASEIGIRKAFGASASVLSIQFIIENVILTLLGGFLAIFISSIAILYLNKNGIGQLKVMSLSINWLVVLIALILCFIFGLMSGAYPAWRMSKLSIVEALKK